MRVLYVFVSIIIKKERGTWTSLPLEVLVYPNEKQHQAHAFIAWTFSYICFVHKNYQFSREQNKLKSNISICMQHFACM